MKNVYEMFLLDPSNFYLGDESKVKMTDKLPWKSVNDHPLPIAANGKQFVLRTQFHDGYSTLHSAFEFSTTGPNGIITHWFELTPPEEELSLDEKLKGEALDEFNRVLAGLSDTNPDLVKAEIDSWLEAVKKLNFTPASQPKENITPSEKHQMDLADKFQKSREKFWGRFNTVHSSFDQSEEQPQEPKQTVELWSVWESKGSENQFYIVYENYQGRTDRFKVWDLKNCANGGVLSIKDLEYSFTPRPDLEVRAPALLKHNCGIEPSVYVNEIYVNEIESKNYKIYSDKLFKWPASLAQMIVVDKDSK